MTKPEECANTKILTKVQLSFLEFCKEFGWGKVEVTIKNGEPVLSREIERLHRHD